jgi:isopenicillin N synthase-like dioxygenase
MSAATLFPAGAVSDHGRIPVLDIGPYLAGDAGAPAPLARAIARTCEDTGFLVVANHGVAPRLIEDTFAVAAQILCPAGARQARTQDRQVQHRLSAVWRPGRAALAGQQEHQAEF